MRNRHISIAGLYGEREGSHAPFMATAQESSQGHLARRTSRRNARRIRWQDTQHTAGEALGHKHLALKDSQGPHSTLVSGHCRMEGRPRLRSPGELVGPRSPHGIFRWRSSTRRSTPRLCKAGVTMTPRNKSRRNSSSWYKDTSKGASAT